MDHYSIVTHETRRHVSARAPLTCQTGFMWPAAWGKLPDAAGVMPTSECGRQRCRVNGLGHDVTREKRRLPLVTWHIRVTVTQTGWDIINASPSTWGRVRRYYPPTRATTGRQHLPAYAGAHRLDLCRRVGSGRRRT